MARRRGRLDPEFEQYALIYRRLSNMFEEAENERILAYQLYLQNPDNAFLTDNYTMASQYSGQIEREYEDHQMEGLRFLPDWVRADPDHEIEYLEDLVYDRPVRRAELVARRRA